jgi:hypothetical protein
MSKLLMRAELIAPGRPPGGHGHFDRRPEPSDVYPLPTPPKIRLLVEISPPAHSPPNPTVSRNLTPDFNPDFTPNCKTSFR